MDAVAAVCVSVAMLSLGLAGRHPPQRGSLRRLMDQIVAHHRQRLALARIPGNPRSYLAMSFIAPIGLFAIGWLQPPVLATSAGIADLLVRRVNRVGAAQAHSRR